MSVGQSTVGTVSVRLPYGLQPASLPCHYHVLITETTSSLLCVAGYDRRPSAPTEATCKSSQATQAGPGRWIAPRFPAPRTDVCRRTRRTARSVEHPSAAYCAPSYAAHLAGGGAHRGDG